MQKYFMLYYDSLSVIDKMSDEQVGKLLRKMRSYHNGNKYDPEELVVDVAFEQFKNQFDRDILAYEVKCNKNAENGKLGGRPKKTQANPKKANGYFENPSKPKKANTNTNTNNNTLIDFIKSKQDITDLYTNEELLINEQITAKYKFVYEFAEWGYSKIPKSKKGIDEFTGDVAEKCIHAIGKIDRHHLRATLRKIKDREQDKGVKTKNYLSRFNNFLLPKN